LKLVFSAATEPGKHRLAALSFHGTSLNINSTKFWANDKGLLSNKMYKCDAKVDLYTEGKNSIAVSEMKLEVFRTNNKTAFSLDNSETCSSDSKVNNLVPIIVGACLGGLILIVLIAYLIGRKRSRHGYEQV
jgi:lysosomal-associated membrane protein 1/2